MKTSEEVTQVRRRVRGPVRWMSRSLGEIDLPTPGPGPEPEMMARLRGAFAESDRFDRLKTGSK